MVFCLVINSSKVIIWGKFSRFAQNWTNKTIPIRLHVESSGYMTSLLNGPKGSRYNQYNSMDLDFSFSKINLHSF